MADSPPSRLNRFVRTYLVWSGFESLGPVQPAEDTELVLATHWCPASLNPIRIHSRSSGSCIWRCTHADSAAGVARRTEDVAEFHERLSAEAWSRTAVEILRESGASQYHPSRGGRWWYSSGSPSAMRWCERDTRDELLNPGSLRHLVVVRVAIS